MKAFLALATVALAPHSTLYSDAWPPARFQGDATVTVRFAPPSSINGHLCGRAPRGMITEACTFYDTDASVWILTLPNPCGYPKADNYARIACHEIGHSQGWPATHGD